MFHFNYKKYSKSYRTLRVIANKETGKTLIAFNIWYKSSSGFKKILYNVKTQQVERFFQRDF